MSINSFTVMNSLYLNFQKIVMQNNGIKNILWVFLLVFLLVWCIVVLKVLLYCIYCILEYISIKNHKIIHYSLLDGISIKEKILKPLFNSIILLCIVLLMSFSIEKELDIKTKMSENIYLSYNETRVERDRLLINIDEKIHGLSDIQRKVVWNLLDIDSLQVVTFVKLNESYNYSSILCDNLSDTNLITALYYSDIENVYQVLDYLK